MSSLDYPLCVYCDNSTNWHLRVENEEVVYHCLSCGNSVVVEASNG